MYLNTHKKGGFTLIEILLVIALIAILAAIVILAINPAEQIGKARDTQRRADVKAIISAIHQYTIDHNGAFPARIPQSSTGCLGEGTYRICRTDASDCTNLVDLSVLTDNEKYMVTLPLNPGFSDDTTTGYTAVINEYENRVTVCAPGTYSGEAIVVTQ